MSQMPRRSALEQGLDAIVEQAIAANPDAVEKYRAGKEKAIGAIVGAVMRETQGRADGGEVERLIRERIGWSRGRGVVPSGHAFERRTGDGATHPDGRQRAHDPRRVDELDDAAFEAAVTEFREQQGLGYIGTVPDGPGKATHVRELPREAGLVIMRRPIAGG